MKLRKLSRMRLCRVFYSIDDKAPTNPMQYNTAPTLDNEVVRGALVHAREKDGRYEFARETPNSCNQRKEIGYIVGAVYEGRKGQESVFLSWKDFVALGRKKRILLFG